MIEYVEVAAAREATGIRIVVSGLVPSPWSEAAKGLFRIANIPVLAVRSSSRNTEVTTWTGVDNVPIVLHGHEPARTNWASITALAARLGGDGVVLPSDPRARADMMGLIDLIAGEDGLGWNGRLAMIDVALTSGRGFAPPVAAYLAKRYGYIAGATDARRERVASQVAILTERLAEQQRLGHAYLAGARVSALDVYLATFLTPLARLPEDACPRLAPQLRAAFETAHEQLGDLVSPALAAHRTMMLEQHLGWPIAI